MSEWNSAPAFTGARLDDLREALGTPQFSGASGTDWYLVFNGMIIQGGQIEVVAGTTAIPFITAFSLQVLGVFLQPIAQHSPAVSATTLSTFDVNHTGATHTCYWWAIGV